MIWKKSIMRKVIVSNVASRDGFFEAPDQGLDWVAVDAEFLDYAKDLLRSVDTLLFGATTYKHMAAHWPFAPQDEIAGGGTPLFRGIEKRIQMKLQQTSVFASGVVVLYYQKA